MSNVVRICVEGKIDAIIIQSMLDRVSPRLKYTIRTSARSLNPVYFIKNFEWIKGNPPGTIFVYDLDEGGLVESMASANALTEFGYKFIPAIPSVEGWLLADSKWSTKFADIGDYEKFDSNFYGRKSPSILKIRNFVKNKYRSNPGYLVDAIRNHFDIDEACSTSPSLAQFIGAISSQSKPITEPMSLAAATRKPDHAITESIRLAATSRKLDHAIFSSLVAEMQPANTVIYKTANGDKYTAGDLRNEILDGSELGISYMESVLRIARNILMFEANPDDPDAYDALGDLEEEND